MKLGTAAFSFVIKPLASCRKYIASTRPRNEHLC